jgi:hypothetical protein
MTRVVHGKVYRSSGILGMWPLARLRLSHPERLPEGVLLYRYECDTMMTARGFSAAAVSL